MANYTLYALFPFDFDRILVVLNDFDLFTFAPNSSFETVYVVLLTIFVILCRVAQH